MKLGEETFFQILERVVEPHELEEITTVLLGEEVKSRVVRILSKEISDPDDIADELI